MLILKKVYHRVKTPVRTYYRKYIEDRLFGMPFVLYFVESKTTWRDLYDKSMIAIDRYLKANASSSSSSEEEEEEEDDDDDDDDDEVTSANDEETNSN